MFNNKIQSLFGIDSDFHTFFNTEFTPYLQELEYLRKKDLKMAWIFGILGFVLLVSIFFSKLIFSFNPAIIKYFSEHFVLVVIILFTAIFLLHISFSFFNNSSFRTLAKDAFMYKIAGLFGDLKYERKKHFSDVKIRESGLFHKYEKQSSDDCFYGTSEGVNIEIYETALTYERNDGKEGKRTVIEFQGVLVLFDMNKSFTGKTIVFQEYGKFGNFLRNTFSSNNYSLYKNVKLEDTKFEKIFEVYSTDQIEARYLLTPTFMEKLCELSKLFSDPKGIGHKPTIQASFFDNQLLLAIPNRSDKFEIVSLFESVLGAKQKKRVQKVIEEIMNILEIVKILKLNEKIGL